MARRGARCPAPNTGIFSNVLTSVDAISANDIWAVGYSIGSERPRQPDADADDALEWEQLERGAERGLLQPAHLGIGGIEQRRLGSGDQRAIPYHHALEREQLERGDRPRTGQ